MGQSRLLITGGTGLFATNASVLLKDQFELHVVSQSFQNYIQGVTVHSCDLSDSKEVSNLVDSIKPDLIINAAGLTSVEQCEENYFKSYLSNVVIAKNLNEKAVELGIKFVHISTDHFSDSSVYQSTETQVELPKNIYASTKMEAERTVLSHNSDALVLRTNFYGWGTSFRSSFTDFIIGKLEKNEEINLFDDVSFSPILIDELVSVLIKLVEKNGCGTFNVCGKEALTKYDFGILLAESFNLNKELIKKDALKNRKGLVERPFDMTMSVDKAEKFLGSYTFKSLKDSFLELSKTRESRQDNLSSLKRVKQNISYGKHHVNDRDINSVVNVLSNKMLTQGSKVEEFEKALAESVGAKYAVAVSSWTSGLHMTMEALEIGEGDAIITSPISFVASSNCALYVGATPLFADIDPKTLNISVESVERLCKENPNVKAIIPVHFAGSPCDMPALRKVADKYNLKIVEDAAHAVGGSYPSGSKIGSCEYSDMVGFSFHPVKNIACGEGGAIITNDSDLYVRLLRLRSHGINKLNHEWVNTDLAFTEGEFNPWYHEMIELGYNFRITDIQCALGLSQLDRLEEFRSRRVEITQAYDHAFKKMGNVEVVQDEQRKISGNHLYVLKVNYNDIKRSRNNFLKELSKSGINGHVHYIPIPLQPYYQEKFPSAKDNIPNAIEYYEKCLTLPLYPSMTNNDVENVITSIKKLVN
jgi:UDP-4-amino-4,6-dideoxy-N-acetyl-beta-L-altrosamine transaminase